MSKPVSPTRQDDEDVSENKDFDISIIDSTPKGENINPNIKFPLSPPNIEGEDRVAPVDWLIDDLVTTILDATPEELPKSYAKLEALATAIDTRWKSHQATIEREARIDELRDLIGYEDDDWHGRIEMSNQTIVKRIKELKSDINQPKEGEK